VDRDTLVQDIRVHHRELMCEFRLDRLMTDGLPQ